MDKILFIDRDGTIIQEPEDFQIDAVDKFTFLPGVISALKSIVQHLDYRLVMVTNQDGLGTDAHPEKDFWPLHELMIRTLKGEGIEFDEVHIDRSFPEDNSPYRKPRTGLLKKYIAGDFNLEESVVIGDRWTDIELANNLNSKSILLGKNSIDDNTKGLKASYKTSSWSEILTFLSNENRKAKLKRNTNETKIQAGIDLDGSGNSEVDTGVKFFDHMLDQLAKHGGLDLFVKVNGDLEVDEHHTIEDTAITLGQLFKQALGKKSGIQRYGFALPMDDVKAQVLIDFGGRSWLEWDAEFQREKIGEMPTEMFHHFFKSFSDNAECNLNIKAEGKNEHHKIEAIFKAFAKAIKMAKERNTNDLSIPSTKGMI